MLDVFRRAAYTAVQVGDHRRAVRVLATLRFDAMVLDAEISPDEIVFLLHGLPRRFPVVVVSSTEPPAPSLRRVAASNLAWLRTPVDREDLLNAADLAIRSGGFKEGTGAAANRRS